jgi:hypothetical protein
MTEIELKEMSQDDINSLSSKEFKNLKPSARRHCADCSFLEQTGATWLCSNSKAIRERKTAIPGVVLCKHWNQSSIKELDKESKLEVTQLKKEPSRAVKFIKSFFFNKMYYLE